VKARTVSFIYHNLI